MDTEYEVIGTGVSPLLMHWDNIEWSDQMEEWRLVPENKQRSKPGDDRTPAWTWIGAMYHDDKFVTIPQENLMRALTDAGAKVPTGKRSETFKRIVPGGVIPLEEFFEFESSRGRIEIQPLFEKLLKEPKFSVHAEYARKLGFRLRVKRVPIGRSKHIRVRPQFDQWSFRAPVLVQDDRITAETLALIVQRAGNNHGIGDWRPSSPYCPGPYGRFTAEVKELR